MGVAAVSRPWPPDPLASATTRKCRLYNAPVGNCPSAGHGVVELEARPADYRESEVLLASWLASAFAEVAARRVAATTLGLFVTVTVRQGVPGESFRASFALVPTRRKQ